MGAQTWVQVANSSLSGAGQGAGGTLSNSSAATDVVPAPTFLSQTWGPMYVGQKWKFEAYGIFSNTGTPTLNLGVYYGGVAGTALLTTGTVTTTTGASNWQWFLQAWVEVLTLGSSGTVRGQGLAYFPTTSTSTGNPQIMSATSQPVTVNTTTTSALTIGATWGTANASNTLTLEGYRIEMG